MKFKIFLCLIVLLASFVSGNAQKVQVVKFEEFEPYLQQHNDTLYMVHFWATWCKPCMIEMPVILNETKDFAGKPFRLVLVSLDFSHHIEPKLKPYLKGQHISGKVFVLDDPDFNSWIDKVSAEWSGGIPATLFYKGNKKEFKEGSFETTELENIIKHKLKNW